MREKSMQMGGAESFENVQKSIYKVLRRVYDQSQIFEIVKYILKPTTNWSLFKLIISDQTLIKLK